MKEDRPANADYKFYLERNTKIPRINSSTWPCCEKRPTSRGWEASSSFIVLTTSIRRSSKIKQDLFKDEFEFWNGVAEEFGYDIINFPIVEKKP